VAILNVNELTSWSDIYPLSSKWTYWDIASISRIQTKQLNNEYVQDDDLRYYINLNISYLADRLNIAAESWYGIYLGANLESPEHYSGLDYIDLTNGYTDELNSFNKIHSIERVSIRKMNVSGLKYWGDATKMSLPKISQLKANLNRNHDQTIAYTVHGKDILMFIGREVGSPSNQNPSYDTLANIVIWAYRQPLLDDMLLADRSGADPDRSKTYNVSGQDVYSNFIDLPDRYAKLLVDMMCKNIYQQIGMQAPAELEQSVNQGLAGISQQESLDLQNQKMTSDKPYVTPMQAGGGNE